MGILFFRWHWSISCDQRNNNLSKISQYSSRALVQLRPTVDLGEKNVEVLQWPSRSPDLNPIENLWKTLKIKIHSRDARNTADLKIICKEWANISKQHCQSLVQKYDNRLRAVIANKGYGTKY